MRIVTSTSAAARLAEARRFLQLQPSSAEVVIVGASRGAADDLARRLAAERGATFGITRFSLTELAARAAAVHLAGARRTPATNTGAEAAAARAVFGAVAAGEVEYFGPVARTPGFPKALARTVHELRLAGVSVADLVDRNRAARDVGHLLERIEEQLRQASTTDRAELFRLAARACDDGQVRWAALPVVLLDVPLDSHAERAFAGALVARSPAVLVDRARRRRDGTRGAPDLRAARRDRDRGRSRRPGNRSGEPAPLRLHARSSSPRRARRRRPPVLGARARDAKRSRSSGACSTRPRAACRSTRWPCFLRDAAAVPRPARARVRARRRAGLLRSRHAAARSGRARVRRAARRAPSKGCRRGASTNTSRSARCRDRGRRRRRSRPAGWRDGAASRPRDEVFARLSRRDRRRHPDDRGAADAGTPSRVDSDEEAVVAGTLRSPWKWEELIVESAVVGGRSRADGKRALAPAARRPGGRLPLPHRRAEARRAGVGAHRALRARPAESVAPARSSRCRSSTRSPSGPSGRPGASGSIGSRRWPPARCGGPARVLQTARRSAADGRRRARSRSRRRATSCTIAWSRSTGSRRRAATAACSSARRIRRAAAAFRVVFVPGLAERVVPQRPREDPLLLDERARGARRGAGRPGRAEPRRASAAEDRDRRGDRAALPLVSAARRRRDARPRAVVLRARRHARDHRPRARPPRAGGRGGRGSRREPGVAGARAIPIARSTISSTTSPSLKPLLDSRDPASVKGPRALPARAERGAAPLGHQPLGARPHRVVDERRPDPASRRRSPAALAQAPARRSAPYSLSALQRFATCPYQFLLATIHRLAAVGRAGAARPHGSADARQPVPQRAGGVLPRARGASARCRSRAATLPAAMPDARRGARSRRRRVRRDSSRPRSSASGATRSTTCAAISASGCRSSPTDGAWQPDVLRVQLRPERRGARSAQPAGSGASSTAGSCCADRSISSSVDRDLDVLRVTDHKTGKNRSNPDLIVGGGAVLQPVLYSVAIEQGLGKKVVDGRLFYCTTAGGFAEHQIAINDYTRGQGLAGADDRRSRGRAAASCPPRPANAPARWCDFRPVCGPREEERVGRKAPDRARRSRRR